MLFLLVCHIYFICAWYRLCDCKCYTVMVMQSNESYFSSATFGLQGELSDAPSVKQELDARLDKQDSR